MASARSQPGDRVPELEPIDQLAAHVRSQLGSRIQYCHAWRANELTRLVVRHWPHGHLESAGGKNCRTIDHALLLMRCQVREHWEARHGIGPLWDLILGGTVTAIAHVVLPLWFSDDRWRAALRSMARRLADDV